MDTGATEMVTPVATEIGPDEYMATAMFKPGTIGVIRHVQRITEESDLGPWRPGFEDLAAPGREYKDGHIDVFDALKALDLRIPVPIPYLLTIFEAANEKLIERCLKNRRRFEESRKGKKSVLRDLPTNEESQPSTSKVHEADRIGMIQTVDSASGKPEALKEALTSAPVLARPDPTRPFALYTDWQPQAISAVLTQHGADGREHVIEYASKTLSQAQANYEACKGECLAVVWGIQHFRPYLYGQKFVLVTDHQPLLSLRNNTDYTGTLGRWALRLQDYDFDIRHRATWQHGNADGLTRLLPPNKCPANERLIPVWTDLLLLRRLPGDSLSELTKAKRRRVTERAQDYHWQGPTLQKRKVDDEGGSSWLTVPHPFARFDWTRAAHEEDAIHFAVKYTEKAIEKNGWYWSGIREDVKYTVQNCPACAADKASVQMPRTMVPTRVERPFQRVSIDTTDINVPRGPVDQGELNVLLVAVDYFSKWIEAYPMTSRNSQEVTWMNHHQPEHEPLEHFQTPLADRLLRHRFNEERKLRYDIQQVNVPAPGVVDLAAYSLLCNRLTYAGVYVDVTQLPGRETTRVFIEFRVLQVAPNFVHSVAAFIGDFTILPQPNREPARSFVREYAVEAARSVARLQGRGGHRFTAHEVLLRRAEDGPIALVPQLPALLPPAAPLNFQAIPRLTKGPYPMREFSEYLVELTNVEPLPFADEDAWELHRALYKSVALGMFRFFVDHEDHYIREHFIVYYVITGPKPAEKEGTVALYPFAQLQTIDPRLLELIHLELLSIAQVIASEEEEIQPRLRTATAPRRTYNAVVIPDYIAQRAERLEDFPEEKSLQPPSSYPRPAPAKAPKKTPKRRRRHPSPGAQGSRIGGGEEVIQPARTRNPDPVPGSAAMLVKGTVVPSPPFPRVPDLNLDGAGPSAAAAAGGGSRMGFLDPISRPPVLAGPLQVDFMVEPATIRLEAIAGAPRPDSAWEPYLTPPFQGCIAARLAGTLIYETGQRPNAMYHFLVFAVQKRERRPYTETHVVMTGPGPRSVRKRVVRAVADLAPRVLSHVPGAFLYPSFVQHHFQEEDVPTTPTAMAAFLPPIPPPLNPDIDHFL
ncbi:hypothetical protein CBR_g26523 [Chara braunii]|uniref:Reverse transcriptase RNase H-like domain-containing protein n=1 Tax=Chara braunii TaxID=69332 RepID=A0A388L885_CHABU|nr:hypothetical protein CBR_g26523 [Chara braunii]|eukprot:GBG78494.1 hypothetical protein CBR_g26523 [Chara braunii]